jgi:predicted nucleic acid-binding protein
MVAAAPALVKAYAVLTRLPFPHRLSAEDALALLEANFMAETRLVALDSKSYQSLLRRAPRESIAGGRVYDAVIMECALKAGSGALLTFNDADFSGLDRKLKIVVPGQAT